MIRYYWLLATSNVVGAGRCIRKLLNELHSAASLVPSTKQSACINKYRRSAKCAAWLYLVRHKPVPQDLAAVPQTMQPSDAQHPLDVTFDSCPLLERHISLEALLHMHIHCKMYHLNWLCRFNSCIPSKTRHSGRWIGNKDLSGTSTNYNNFVDAISSKQQCAMQFWNETKLEMYTPDSVCADISSLDMADSLSSSSCWARTASRRCCSAAAANACSDTPKRMQQCLVSQTLFY